MKEVMERLGLAEIYLLDGAPNTTLRCIRQAMALGDQTLPESEDVGDVSDHILRAAGVWGIA